VSRTRLTLSPHLSLFFSRERDRERRVAFNTKPGKKLAEIASFFLVEFGTFFRSNTNKGSMAVVSSRVIRTRGGSGDCLVQNDEE